MRTGTSLKRQLGCAGLFAALTYLVSAPAVAQSSEDWVDIKDPDELKALYSNTTFRGKLANGDAFTAYNRADGLRQFVFANRDEIQKWRADGNEICFQGRYINIPEVCTTFQKHATRNGEYQARRVKDGATTTFKVEPGIKGAREF
jgi:hypothetical protein